MNSVTSLLSSKLPDPRSELVAASILANMNRINQSPCSDEVESLTSSSGNEMNIPKPPPPKPQEQDKDEIEQPEEVCISSFYTGNREFLVLVVKFVMVNFSGKFMIC